MTVFKHPQAICETKSVGARTRIWAFAHVLPGARIGADCNIRDHTLIENDVAIGDRVTVKCGVQLWDGARIGNDVFIGPDATFSNDSFPRSSRQEFLLDQPAVGVYLPPRTWGVQYDCSPDAALFVFASRAHNARDYVRDHEAFLTLVRR